MSAPCRARAILLTGVVGTGKTSVAVATGALLEAMAEPYALVDLDWLAWLRPGRAETTVHEVLVANLRAVWRTFREAGVRRLVLARHLEDVAQLAALRSALPDVEVVVVRLVAPTPVLERRLRARDTGAELDEHLAELAGQHDAVPADAVVASHDRSPAAVAVEVLHRAGWRTDEAAEERRH